MRIKQMFITACLCATALFALPAFADKSSVTIEAPEAARKGSIVTIRLTIHHKGNNFLHYTDWAYLKVNGKEVQRWEFTRKNLPEIEVFSREVQYTVNGPVDIEAEANCNIHGGKGPSKARIDLK